MQTTRTSTRVHLRTVSRPLEAMLLLAMPPCGRAIPGSPEDLRSLDSVSSCRRGQGGRTDCLFCAES
jgi:hypothetical protein